MDSAVVKNRGRAPLGRPGLDAGSARRPRRPPRPNRCWPAPCMPPSSASRKFESALSYHLARLAGTTEVPAALIRQIFDEALSADPAIG